MRKKPQRQLASIITEFLGKPAWDYEIAWPEMGAAPYAKIFVQWDQGDEWVLHGTMRIELSLSSEHNGT
jgi:hypothetical protein